MKRCKLHYTIHNSNNEEATADFLIGLFVEANRERVDYMLREEFKTEESDKESEMICKQNDAS